MSDHRKKFPGTRHISVPMLLTKKKNVLRTEKQCLLQFVHNTISLVPLSSEDLAPFVPLPYVSIGNHAFAMFLLRYM